MPTKNSTLNPKAVFTLITVLVLGIATFIVSEAAKRSTVAESDAAEPTTPSITLKTPYTLRKGTWQTINFSVSGKADSITLSNEFPISKIPSGCKPLAKRVPVLSITCDPTGTYNLSLFIPENTTKKTDMFFVRVWYGGSEISKQATVSIASIK